MALDIVGIDDVTGLVILCNRDVFPTLREFLSIDCGEPLENHTRPHVKEEGETSLSEAASRRGRI